MNRDMLLSRSKAYKLFGDNLELMEEKRPPRHPDLNGARLTLIRVLTQYDKRSDDIAVHQITTDLIDFLSSGSPE